MSDAERKEMSESDSVETAKTTRKPSKKPKWFEEYGCGCVSEYVARKKNLLGIADSTEVIPGGCIKYMNNSETAKAALRVDAEEMEACCAHMHVRYRTRDEGSGITGWWQCSDCCMRFLPGNLASHVTDAAISAENEACARLVHNISSKARDDFKGRGDRLKWGDTYWDGFSDGAGEAEVAIRARGKA